MFLSMCNNQVDWTRCHDYHHHYHMFITPDTQKIFFCNCKRIAIYVQESGQEEPNNQRLSSPDVPCYNELIV